MKFYSVKCCHHSALKSSHTKKNDHMNTKKKEHFKLARKSISGSKKMVTHSSELWVKVKDSWS